MYYCKQCGMQYPSDDVSACINCGTPKLMGAGFCSNCGRPVNEGAAVCTNCGAAITITNPGNAIPGAKSKVTAGLLGIFLGAFGVHNFYLGYTAKAIIQLSVSLLGIVLSCIGIGAFITLGIEIWGLVEGIMILTGKINVDGKGIPLAD